MYKHYITETEFILLTAVRKYYWLHILFQGEGTKLWGGRFSQKTDTFLEKLNASIVYDKRMWYEDIQVSGLHMCI